MIPDLFQVAWKLLWFPILPALAGTTIVTITDGPETDKDCYRPSETGVLSVSFTVDNLSVPLDQYRVAWNTHPDGSGTWYIKGTTLLVHGNVPHTDDRWTSIITCQNMTEIYQLNVKDLKLVDETPDLFAFITDIKSDLTVAKSSSSASFKVREDCTDGAPSPPPSPSDDESPRGGLSDVIQVLDVLVGIQQGINTSIELLSNMSSTLQSIDKNTASRTAIKAAALLSVLTLLILVAAVSLWYLSVK